MILKFNDATELQAQSAELVGNLLQIKTISVTQDELRTKFQDEFACKKIQVVAREQAVAEYENYTQLLRVEEYTGGILGVAMEQVGKSTEERLAENEEQVTILKEDAKNADTQITDLQGAICELYEMGVQA